MSIKGIKKFASILSQMQQMRIELLNGDNQDIRLGNLLHDMKELTNVKFMEITLKNKKEF
jgi:hypothetical protein